MRLPIVFISILSLIFFSFKDERKYPISDIPENLKQGMYAVIRENETRFEILAIDKSSVYTHYAITILNENGKKYAIEVLGYDKDSKITTFKGTVYDALGNVIKKLKQNEIYDQSSISGFSLYEDNRLQRADMTQATYPYTVEFEYEIQYQFLYNIQNFYLYSDDEVSIQKTAYTVTYPPQFSPRFKLNKIDPPIKSEKNGKETVSWTFENILPPKFEPLSPDLVRIVPNILAGPSEFEYGGYKGKMSSWEEYGKWKGALIKDRNALPEATKQKVRELTKGLSTTEQKARVLYEYLQSKTRYVSIQEGIGGLQPFQASVVDQTGYGDCKALSNYMVALLKEVGVPANYTTIRAGESEPDVIVDFPSHQSNHVIVAIPDGADTLWLECTSQTNPFGYMGSFTGGRKALMITNTGGKLVNTPNYPLEQNTQYRTAEVTIDVGGDAKAKIKTTYSGLQYENDRLDSYINASNEEQKKWVQESTKIPSFDLMGFSMVNRKNKIPSAIVIIDLSLRRYASVSGKRLFLTPNLMNRSKYVPAKVEARKTNVVKKLAFVDADTIFYHFPEELYPEFVPQLIKVSSRFGEYECNFKIESGKLIYIRKLKMVKGEFPPESYNELIDFYKNIGKADNTKIVFLNKT